MNRTFVLGFVAAFGAVLAWGIQLPVAKDAFVAVNPFHLSLFRYVVAVSFLSIILVVHEGRGAFRYRGKGLWAIPLGVVGMCICPISAFIGMAMTSAEHCVVIGSLQPTIAALAVWIFQRKRPATFTLVCIVGAFLGVMLVVSKGDVQFFRKPGQLLGDFIILGGAVGWLVYTAGVGRLHGWSTWRVTVLTMLPGTVATLLVTQVMVSLGRIEVPTLAAIQSVAWPIAYLSFIGVLTGMLAWNFGARRIGIVNSSLLINFMPVVTFAYRAFQGHAFEQVELAGAGMVVSALIANNMYLRRQYLNRAAPA